MKLCHFEAGIDQPLFIIAGPDTLESEQLALDGEQLGHGLDHQVGARHRLFHLRVEAERTGATLARQLARTRLSALQRGRGRVRQADLVP